MTALDLAVFQRDGKELSKLLNRYRYSENQLSANFIVAIRYGYREISDMLAEKLNYDLGLPIIKFSLGTMEGEEYSREKEGIVNRILDLANHRNATIDYKYMEKILENLLPSNDDVLAKILDYYLSTTPLTTASIKNLERIAEEDPEHTPLETVGVIQSFLPQKIK